MEGDSPVVFVSDIQANKKAVLVLSTKEISPADTETPAASDNAKPEVILKYNKKKGAVDTCNEMIKAYTCKPICYS